SFRRSPSRVRGRCTPGVSTRINCTSSRCTTPRMACLVVWGLPEVIATFVPTRALVRVDLPALGRPTTHTNPERYSGSVIVLPLHRLRPSRAGRRAPALHRPPRRAGCADVCGAPGSPRPAGTARGYAPGSLGWAPGPGPW